LKAPIGIKICSRLEGNNKICKKLENSKLESGNRCPLELLFTGNCFFEAKCLHLKHPLSKSKDIMKMKATRTTNFKKKHGRYIFTIG
jgi:hypothetical protein